MEKFVQVKNEAIVLVSFCNFEYIYHCIVVSTDFVVVIVFWVIVISNIWWIYTFSFVHHRHSDSVFIVKFLTYFTHLVILLLSFRR